MVFELIPEAKVSASLISVTLSTSQSLSGSFPLGLNLSRVWNNCVFTWALYSLPQLPHIVSNCLLYATARIL